MMADVISIQYFYGSCCCIANTTISSMSCVRVCSYSCETSPRLWPRNMNQVVCGHWGRTFHQWDSFHQQGTHRMPQKQPPRPQTGEVKNTCRTHFLLILSLKLYLILCSSLSAVSGPINLIWTFYSIQLLSNWIVVYQNPHYFKRHLEWESRLPAFMTSVPFCVMTVHLSTASFLGASGP